MGAAPSPRDDLERVELPFVAFRARYWMTSLDDDVDGWRWTVTTLDSEPDDAGIHYIPQLDARGQEALAFLEAFVASLK